MTIDADTQELSIADLADAIADLEGKIDDVLTIMVNIGETVQAAAKHPLLGQFLGGKQL